MNISNQLSSMMLLSIGISLLFILAFSQESAAAPRQAQYANLSYDVVYVRCPRGKPVAVVNDQENWNGVNDIWLSASNNIYQQPGCDLMLHRSDLPRNDPNAEQVLVDCNEDTPDASAPICTIADPNISFDGTTVVYTKFEDTRNFIKSTGMNTDGGWGPTKHYQSFMRLYPNGDGPKGYANRIGVHFNAFDAPAYVYSYNLNTKVETRVSPTSGLFAGRAHPGKDPDWTSNIPVMDTGPFFLPDGRIGFTSNRESGFYKFQLFAMDLDGKNLQLFGHRAMSQQLHPAILKDGRILYTSNDTMLKKSSNNQYSLFTIGPDGQFPFIFAGKHDASAMSYHFATQLSDGDVVVTVYYNHNNTGLGALWRMPVDPPGADFEHQNVPNSWVMGINMLPFARKGQFKLTSQADAGDSIAIPYREAAGYGLSEADEWLHPDGRRITMMGKFTHPAATIGNDLLVTYTIGGSSTMPGPYGDLASTQEVIGKDAGIWLLPLDPNSTKQVGHIADDAQLVVDDPNYHEIMARPVVSYNDIYGIPNPDPTGQYRAPKNNGNQDQRLAAGSPFALSGASSLYDRETRSVNGTPWNASGSPVSGRNYMNLLSSGADLAIYGNDEVYGIRVLLPDTYMPTGAPGGKEMWAGQGHHLRILGEFPIRKSDGTLLDAQGNPDTSFMVKLPADTPFLFQSIDKRGMALDIETTSRSAARGEKQLCIGCHVHTREGIDPSTTPAIADPNLPYADFSGKSAPLFDDLDANGNPTVRTAREIYSPSIAPGVDKRRSFAVDWRNGISDIIQSRCAACHAEGKPAQVLTGLRLDNDDRTYQLLVRNSYTREDGARISASTQPGDGLNDVINETPGTDRITNHDARCCTVSRWISVNSARSSMLIWALYGERMDGRNPETGLPFPDSGVLVDYSNLESPEVWPKVAEHLAYLDGTSTVPGATNMPEAEKRLLARWVDIGAPKLNVHDDMVRPVLTITPVVSGGSVSAVKIGLWDDSTLDYSTFVATKNGSPLSIAPIVGEPDVIDVDLATTVDVTNADAVEFVFEIWDKPDRSLSLVDPSYSAANRIRKTVTGRELLRLADSIPNSAPSATSATISTYESASSKGTIPSVSDADAGDIHLFNIETQPSNGRAEVVSNRLVYTPNAGFIGSDTFTYRASDLEGASVVGTAVVTVLAAPVPEVSLSVASSPIQPGSNATLMWSSNFATSCTASGSWNGSKGTSGSQSVGPISKTSDFIIECSGTGGKTSRSVTVETTTLPTAAQLTLTASSSQVSEGDYVTLDWSGSGVDSCTANGAWTGARPTSGTQEVGPITSTSTFSLSCAGNNGSALGAVIVDVRSTGSLRNASSSDSGGGSLGWLSLLLLLAAPRRYRLRETPGR